MSMKLFGDFFFPVNNIRSDYWHQRSNVKSRVIIRVIEI